METIWKETLLPLAKLPHVAAIRIRGSIAAVEVNAPGGYLADVSRRLRLTCLNHGVLLRPLGNLLYTMPPFCTSQESLKKIAAAMTDAVKSL
jgi:adenosylmethionine-8-amino-7-oxononanoate aminotransferase